MAELYGNDPHGNTMPPGMFFRDGYYHVRKMVNGERRKRTTEKRDYKSALRRYNEIMVDWNNEKSGWKEKPPVEVPTVSVWWLKYRGAHVVGTKTPLPDDPEKYRDDSLMIAFLRDHGSTKLDAFTPSDCAEWTQKRLASKWTRKVGGAEYSTKKSTVAREVQLIHTLFHAAIEDKLIPVDNPWKKTLKIHGKYEKRDRVLTPDEQRKLLAVLSVQFQRFVLFLLGSGLRLGELRQVNESADLDFPKRWVQVTRKTRGLDKKVQKVPLIDPLLLDILQEQLADCGELWHQNASGLRRRLAQASKKADIPHLSPHALRHTFATRYLQGGGDIYVLSKILGHANVGVTEKVYAHLLTEDLLLRSQHVKLGLVY